MQTCLFKEDQEPMLKQEFNVDDTSMYLDEEGYEAFIKVESEESIKEMIVSENRPQTPPRPRHIWRNNAVVIIERQPEYDRILQASDIREVNKPSPMPRPSSKRDNATIDPYNPQHYCTLCNKTYPHQVEFRQHLRMVHSLDVKYFKYPHATIDPYNPQNYCAKCDRSYAGTYFRRHLRLLHGLLVKRPKRSRAILGPYTPRKRRRAQKVRKRKRSKLQHCCTKCDRTYASKYTLRLHLKTKHDNEVLVKYPNADIDIFNLKNYCAKCDVRYRNASVFFIHLKDKHQSTLCNIRDAVKISNEHDPTYYCPKCDRYYTEEIFKQHLTNHRSSRPVNVNPDAEIDMNSPDFYCSKCEHRFSSQSGFKSHLNQTHNLSHEWARANRQRNVIYPNAEIDFYNPDGYCAKCDKRFKKQRGLWSHAASLHATYPRPLSRKPVEHGVYNLRNGKKLTPIFC